MALDKWIQKVRAGEFLAEEELKSLCDVVKEVLVEESNVQPVSSPVVVSRTEGVGGFAHWGFCGRTSNARVRQGAHANVSKSAPYPLLLLGGPVVSLPPGSCCGSKCFWRALQTALMYFDLLHELAAGLWRHPWPVP